jgi:HD-GYP domain-containing protein (c-di-GMP phosphodiesterase class II)
MEATNRIDKAVLVTTSRDELLARVASIIDISMRSTAVAIALRDESGQGWNIAALTDSATLHDVGKIGIGEAILDKPESLTADKYAQIKQHPAIGATI